MKRSIATITLALLLLLPASSVHSASVSENGLLITPIRQFLSVNSGRSVHSDFTVENLSDKPLAVTFTVKQFSVTNYTYNYTFNQPANDWLHLSLPGASLQPHQSLKVSYNVDTLAGSSPGGYYYTLFAGANLTSQGISSTIQATDLLYLTVNGKLTRTSHLQTSSIHWLSFGRSIPFTLQPVNTGNVYFFAYVSGQLHGLLTGKPAGPETHLLMPGKVRTITGSINSPVLPGVYRATYGYKTDTGQTVAQSHWILFIPPWFIAFLLAALLIAGKFWSRHKRRLLPAQHDTNEAAKDN